jgi:hypothetical protein
MAQNQKIISDYSSLSTAKRGAARRKFGDLTGRSLTRSANNGERALRRLVVKLRQNPNPNLNPNPKFSAKAQLSRRAKWCGKLRRTCLTTDTSAKTSLPRVWPRALPFYTARTQYQKWFATLKNN